LKAEAKQNQSQILAKYLINFTTNCFVQAAAVPNLGAVLWKKICKILLFLRHLVNELNSAEASQFLQNSARAASYHP